MLKPPRCLVVSLFIITFDVGLLWKAYPAAVWLQKQINVNKMLKKGKYLFVPIIFITFANVKPIKDIIDYETSCNG
jgi:hypothetical protein